MKFKEYKKMLAIVTVTAILAALPGASVLAAPAADTYNLFPVTKNETVYIKTDESGKTRKIVVSDELQNTGDAGALSDISDLKNIENVKGEENFTQSGDQLVWNNKGEDIVYQGKTDEAPPVGVTITYELDGKKIAPKKLEGKSGHLIVRYDYSLDQEKTGNQFTPFLMVTGVVLDQKKFKNVELSANGHFESDGQRMTVVGYAVPGLLDYLGISEKSADLGDQLSLSDSFTFEADVEDYSAPTGGTIATNEIFSKMNAGNAIDSADSLEAALNQLADSSKQLVSGSAVLSSGVKELQSGSSALADGVSQLAGGGSKLAGGADSLASGAGQLSAGVDQMKNQVGASMPLLTGALDQLAQGAAQLSTGINQAAAGAQAVSGGIAAVNQSAAQLAGGAQTVAGGIETAGQSAAALAQSAKAIQATMSEEDQAKMAALITNLDALSASLSTQSKLGAGAGQVASGAQQLAAATGSDSELAQGAAAVAGALSPQGQLGAGAAALSSGLAQAGSQAGTMAGTLTGALGQLSSGASDLANGSAALSSGANDLSNGLNTLNTKVPALTSGVDQLAAGSDKLADGMSLFDAEGIQKLVSYMGGDMTALIQKASAMIDNAKAYNNYSGISEDMQGSVKFVFVQDID